MTVDPLACWVLAAIPITVVGWGVFGVLMPAYWNPIAQAGGDYWYAFIPVTNWLTALLSVPLGVAFIGLGLWIAPLFLRWYGQSARSMLAPTKQAALQRQVAHLSESRAEVVDTGAAEIRRIERDLHTGTHRAAGGARAVPVRPQSHVPGRAGAHHRPGPAAEPPSPAGLHRCHRRRLHRVRLRL
jgi:hypothetical protein